MSNGSIQGQTYLSLQGGELQGNVEMNGNKITGLGNAVNDGDAVNLKMLKDKTEFDNQGILKFAKYAGQIPVGGAYNTIYTISFDWLPTLLIFKGKPYRGSDLSINFYLNTSGTIANKTIYLCDDYINKECIGTCRLSHVESSGYVYFQRIKKKLQYDFDVFEGIVLQQRNKYIINIMCNQQSTIPAPLQVYYI